MDQNQELNIRVRGEVRQLYQLSTNNLSVGNIPFARFYCQQAIDILKKNYGFDDIELASMNILLARINMNDRSCGTYQVETKELLLTALAIREKKLGRDHADVAAALNTLSIYLKNIKNYQESENLCKRALDIRLKFLGYNHPDVALQYCDYGVLCRIQGHYNEASLYFEKALYIYKSTLPNDPNMAKIKNYLCSIYILKKRYSEAENLYKEVLSKAHEKVYGQLDEENKPYWQWVDEKELDQIGSQSRGFNMPITYTRNGENSQENSQENSPVVSLLPLDKLFEKEQEFLKVLEKTAKIDEPYFKETLQNLGFLYVIRGKGFSAKLIQKCLSKMN